MYSSLPPSGPSAGGYYNREVGVGDRVPGGGPPPVPSNGLHDPRSSPVGSGNGSSGGEYDGGAGPQPPPPPSPSDPLGTMDSLRQTLPDVGGAPTEVGASDN